MTTALKKLIADNKWRPIEERPKDGNWFLANYAHGEMRAHNEPPNCVMGEWREIDGRWRGCGGLRGFPTHFRPLPDDRLAKACEVLLGALQIMAEDKRFLGIPIRAMNALARAEEIAKGGE